jgi:hypothetical protein
MNKIQSELEKIQIPDEVMDYMYKGLHQAKREEHLTGMNQHGSRKRKKLIGSLAGLVAVGGLLFGSTFVSPAMADMAAKIPYLRDMFIKDIDKEDVKSVFALLREEGLRRGYTVQTMTIGGWMKDDDPDKLTVYLKDKDYNDKTKLEVETLTKEILDQKGFYSKSLEVLPFKEDFYQSMRRINVITTGQAKEIKKLVKDKGYQVDFVGMNRGIDEVFVMIPVTEKRMDEVRNVIQNYQKEHDNEFSLDIRTVDLNNVDQETKLKQKLYMIFEGLVAKKEYKVDSFTYSNKDQLVITIETSLEKKDKKIEEQIRNEVSSQLDKEYKKPYTIDMVGLDELKSIVE